MPSVPKLVLIGDTLVSLFRNLVRVRQFAEQLQATAAEGLAVVHDPPSVGGEAVAVGVSWHLNDSDMLFVTAPAHGCALARGVSAPELAAQYLGRRAGCGGGVGGGRAFAAPKQGLLGVLDDSAAAPLHATGAALAAQIRGREGVSVALFQQGGLLDGALHEALRIAGDAALPVVFVGQADGDSQPLSRLATTAQSYGVSAIDADGRFVAETYAAAHEAVRRARAKEGPSLLLFDVVQQPNTDELDEDDDPVELLRDHLEETDAMSEEELDELLAEAAAEMQEACARAVKAPEFDPQRAARRLFSQPIPGRS